MKQGQKEPKQGAFLTEPAPELYPRCVSLPKVDIKQKIVSKNIELYKKEYTEKLLNKVQRRAQDETKMRTKSLMIEERQKRASENGKLQLDTKLAKVTTYKKRAEETQQRLQSLTQTLQQTRAERYEKKQEEYEMRMARKMQLEKGKVARYKEKEEQYKKKLQEIKFAKAVSDDDSIVEDVLKKYELESNFYWSSCNNNNTIRNIITHLL